MIINKEQLEVGLKFYNRTKSHLGIIDKVNSASVDYTWYKAENNEFNNIANLDTKQFIKYFEENTFLLKEIPINNLYPIY